MFSSLSLAPKMKVCLVTEFRLELQYCVYIQFLFFSSVCVAVRMWTSLLSARQKISHACTPYQFVYVVLLFLTFRDPLVACCALEAHFCVVKDGFVHY